MHFLLIVGFYLITLGLIVKHRFSLARLFLRMPGPALWAAAVAAFVFSVIEEAAHNVASGTLHVLLGTVPPLVVFVLVSGKLGQLCGARTIRYPLLGLMLFGIAFEYFFGSSSEGFQNPESTGHLVFGVVFTAVAYAYTAVVALTIMLEAAREPPAHT